MMAPSPTDLAGLDARDPYRVDPRSGDPYRVDPRGAELASRTETIHAAVCAIAHRRRVWWVGGIVAPLSAGAVAYTFASPLGHVEHLPLRRVITILFVGWLPVAAAMGLTKGFLRTRQRGSAAKLSAEARASMRLPSDALRQLVDGAAAQRSAGIYGLVSSVIFTGCAASLLSLGHPILILVVLPLTLLGATYFHFIARATLGDKLEDRFLSLVLFLLAVPFGVLVFVLEASPIVYTSVAAALFAVPALLRELLRAVLAREDALLASARAALDALRPEIDLAPAPRRAGCLSVEGDAHGDT